MTGSQGKSSPALLQLGQVPSPLWASSVASHFPVHAGPGPITIRNYYFKEVEVEGEGQELRWWAEQELPEAGLDLWSTYWCCWEKKWSYGRRKFQEWFPQKQTMCMGRVHFI